MYVDIPKPSEKQTIAMFVANTRRCEELHSKAPLPKFGSECDRVVQKKFGHSSSVLLYEISTC